MSTYEDMFADGGILTSWHDHPARLADRPELAEKTSAQPLLVRVQELAMQGVEYGADTIRHHRKAAAAIGGTALGFLGFATGAKISSHRTAH